MTANYAGDAVPALTTTRSWKESRGLNRPLFPREAFAVYFIGEEEDFRGKVEMEAIVEALNGGFGGRKKEQLPMVSVP